MPSLGKYEILEEIGRGAYAVVYRARDTEQDQIIALKVLHHQLALDSMFAERFKREARTITELDHSHITAVHEVGDADEQLYIAMNLARGPSLARRIQEQGVFPWKDALEVLEQVVSALDHAHGKGFIHRDIKPSNILFDPDRGALLCDFGLSKMIESSSYSLTVSGGILGTPAYIAPEIWAGEKPTPASDVYALGCVLYEMITGEVLFDADSPLVVMRRHDEGPQFPDEWPEGTPAYVETVLAKALAEKNKRYQSSGEMVYALREAAEAEKEQARQQKERLARLYRHLQAAVRRKDWTEALTLGDQILALDPNYPGVPALMERVKAQMRRPPPAASPQRDFRKLLKWGWLAGGLAVLVLAVVLIQMALGENGDENEVIGSGALGTLIPSATSLPKMTPLPSVTPLSIPPPATPTQGIPECYDIAFVADVTIPDDTELAPGTEFVKTWRLRNSGDCAWGAGTALVFASGDKMDGPDSVSVSVVEPGDTIDVSVNLTAPDTPGTYTGYWKMRHPNGAFFGTPRSFVRIVVPGEATASLIAPTTTPGSKPDLDIILVAGNLALEVGETLELQVTVKNHGPGATEAEAMVRVVLWADLILETNAPALPAGAQETVSLRHTFDAPAYLDVALLVDPQGRIAEEDEYNNSEWASIVANPPLYATGTIIATPGHSFDLDNGASETRRLDVEWQVIEGMIYLGLLNGAGAAPLAGEAESLSYALVAGLTWEPTQLLLADLAEGTLFGFRTSDGRVGYARVAAVLDPASASVQLDYWVWDWP